MAENPADAVEGLREVDARGGVADIAENRGVRVGDGFQKRETGGDDADSGEESEEGSVGETAPDGRAS